MQKIESFADDQGNVISIHTVDDGLTVQAHIVTLPPYTGGSNAEAARAYAKRHGLRKQ